MGLGKWIAGFLGWAAWGPIGGLLGYLAGAYLEERIEASRQIGSGSGTGQGTSYGQSGQGTYGQSSSTRRYTQTEQRNSFFMSLLVLSSAVIRADGKTTQAEIDTVRSFVRDNFGEEAAQQAVEILNRLGTQEINVYSVGDQIASNMNYSQRLQLFHYLVRIATADGDFAASEKSVLEAIGSVIRLTSTDVASVIAMFYKDNDAAYTVLEISPSATNDEVKKAYRRMAMKYHPDKVANMSEEVQQNAARQFREIKEAYEQIMERR